MKTVEVSRGSPTLVEVLRWAEQHNVILNTGDGRQFVVAQIDNAVGEATKVMKRKSLIQLLEDRSKDQSRIPLKELEEELEQGKRRTGKRRRVG